ncbi:MAG: nucleoside monophosphate kinase [Nanoarchaeota archaeon]|nr:nucleoside monophosphate kinase [Nanoarchaeota archaeon]
MKIILLGKQGSGKGTQGELISEKYQIPLITAGDLLRKISKEHTSLGKKVKEILNSGKLAPNELTNKIILNEIKSLQSFILDGFPRSMIQALALEKAKIKLDYIFLIDIDDSLAIERLSARRVCSKCKEIYNVITKKPKKQSICDKCKGKLVQRDDDKPDAIKKRLSIFRKETLPVLNLYKKKSIVHIINGEPKPKMVFEDIKKIFKR